VFLREELKLTVGSTIKKDLKQILGRNQFL